MKMGYADMMSLAVAEAIEARRAVAWLRYPDGMPAAPYRVGKWMICGGFVGVAA